MAWVCRSANAGYGIIFGSVCYLSYFLPKKSTFCFNLCFLLRIEQTQNGKYQTHVFFHCEIISGIGFAGCTQDARLKVLKYFLDVGKVLK